MCNFCNLCAFIRETYVNRTFFKQRNIWTWRKFIFVLKVGLKTEKIMRMNLENYKNLWRTLMNYKVQEAALLKKIFIFIKISKKSENFKGIYVLIVGKFKDFMQSFIEKMCLNAFCKWKMIFLNKKFYVIIKLCVNMKKKFFIFHWSAGQHQSRISFFFSS